MEGCLTKVFRKRNLEIKRALLDELWHIQKDQELAEISKIEHLNRLQNIKFDTLNDQILDFKLYTLQS